MSTNLDLLDLNNAKKLKIVERDPLVLWSEPTSNVFEVKLKAPGIIPGKPSKPHDAKNGNADVTILKQGMDVMIEVDDLKTETKTVYRFKIKRFPSPINRQLSSWKVDKDYIIITLLKKEPIDWMSTVRRRGLDMSSSSSSSGDEEEPCEARGATAMPRRVLRLDEFDSGIQRVVVIEERIKEPHS